MESKENLRDGFEQPRCRASQRRTILATCFSRGAMETRVRSIGSRRWSTASFAAWQTTTCRGSARDIRCKLPRLVHEAYTRLVDYKRMQWKNRAHFFAVAAQLMRRILVDHARRNNIKRGADFRHVALDGVVTGRSSRDPYRPDLVALDDAMNLALPPGSPCKRGWCRGCATLVDWSVEETAEVLNISAITVKRDWRVAKNWLFRELTGYGETNGPGTLEAS